MNKKILSFTLAIATALTLSGCGQKVDHEKAKAFAEENYVAENVTSTKCVSKTVMEVKKAEGIFAAMFEVGKKETEIEFDSVEGLFGSVGAAFNDKYEYVINGKKLTVSKKTSVKDYLAEYDVATNENTKLSGKGVVETYHFNEEGLLVDSTVSVDVSFSASSMGITVSGAINMYTSVNNTYSK